MSSGALDDDGLQQAAILLMSLGEEEASEVFKHLAPKEVQRLGETIAKMRSVSRDKVEAESLRFGSSETAKAANAGSKSSREKVEAVTWLKSQYHVVARFPLPASHQCARQAVEGCSA